MKYRRMKAGEIIEPTDEYISYHCPSQSTYIPVDAVSVGKAILECNVKYYRRPVPPRENKGENDVRRA